MDKKKWIVLWSSTGISFISGILYVWSVISKGLMQELHWTSAQASLPYTTVTIAFVIGMLIFGKVQDSKGPRICLVLSGILMGGGLILSGFALRPLLLVITFGIIVGAGIGTVNVSATPPAMKWFPPEKKGMVSGIVVGGVGIATVFFSPVSNYVINNYGISQTFIFFGVFSLVGIFLLTPFVKNPPPGYKYGTGETISNNSDLAALPVNKTEFSRIEMLKTKEFYIFWLMLAFSSSAGLMIIGHAANIAKVQVNWEGGFLLVILLSIFNAGGRLAGGMVSDKIGRINTMRVAFFLQALNMLLFGFYHSIGILGAGIAVAGMCYGATFAIFPATIADVYGMKNFSANYSTLFTAWGFGGVIGPMTAAYIIDATKSYNKAYLIACFLLVLAEVLTLTFKVRQWNNS